MKSTMRTQRNLPGARLRPFVRRDLRSRLISAAIALIALIGMSWLAVSGFALMDNSGAHRLRTHLGLEAPYAQCGGPEGPMCNYDDQEQARIDKIFERDQQARISVLAELEQPYLVPLEKPTVRYRSPITDLQRRQLLGAVLFALSALLLLVVAPSVTASATAREREAGTLPVLRMTGMSSGDLAMAMIIGPNVFALVTGVSLLVLGALLLATTSATLASISLATLLLLVFAAATSLTAVGLGDALGQRVNAMVVGGLLAAALLGPGLLGGFLALFNVANAGLLLGPLPGVLASAATLTGIPALHRVLSSDLTPTLLTYAVVVQVLLGMLCLRSWRRRVEHGRATLFRPSEGIALAVASMGCSALSLLDISAQANAQSFNTLNMLTILSSGFLLPLLGWLLLSSLRRPAHARAIASHTEARRAFLRFQAVLILSAAFIGSAYWVVLRNSGFLGNESEIMWATLSQALLLVESAIATLLWTARRRGGRLRVALGGGAIVLTQLAMGVVVYGLEVRHVARTGRAALPLLVNADISIYWLVIIAALWTAGVAIVVVALMRDRGDPSLDEEEDDEAKPRDRPNNKGSGMPGRRLIH